MNVVTQLVRLLRQRGEPPVISEARTAIAETNRLDARAQRVLRDKEAVDWLRRGRPIESDHFPERRQA